MSRAERSVTIEAYSAALKANRTKLAELIHLEAGKTEKESLAEADGSADILLKTIKDAALPELGGMLRRKERPRRGVVGLITSFNFPMVVAHWTLAPALLAGNAVIWKPSEKTPLTALACKAIFDKVFGAHAEIFAVAVGGREAGESLVKSEGIDIVSATGSVGNGQGHPRPAAAKKNNALPPVLELGGNNGIIISNKISEAHLEWSVKSLFTSFLGSTGQRCTDTRRLIVHKDVIDKVVALLKAHIESFLAASAKDGGFDPANEFGYGPLIDEDAFRRFENAKKRASEEGGKILFGARLFADKNPAAYYVEPALAVMKAQTPIMYEETFAPLLFIAPYGSLDEAFVFLNAPENGGLVGGIYTQSQAEADRFARENQAGHGVINSAKGTGTPAFGMGFGGNKASGSGEILNAADPLAAFTRPGSFSRIAQNKDISMDRD